MDLRAQEHVPGQEVGDGVGGGGGGFAPRKKCLYVEVLLKQHRDGVQLSSTADYLIPSKVSQSETMYSLKSLKYLYCKEIVQTRNS